MNQLFSLYKSTDCREQSAQLIFVEEELAEAMLREPDNRYLKKASSLVRKTFEMVKSVLSGQTSTIKHRRQYSQNQDKRYKWRSEEVHFVELVYGLVESKSIESEDGVLHINEFAEHLGAFFGVDLRDSHDSYSSTIKKRKSEDRAYFLNKLASGLNRKMDKEDNHYHKPYIGHARTLFDEE